MPAKSAFSRAKTEEFFNDLRFANSEQAKKERFVQYITAIYAGDAEAQRVISRLNLGAELFVTNIPRHNKLSYGRADTQSETVIVEWESDLRKTGEHAKLQLAEYLTGNWNSGKQYHFTLIATDGQRWVLYAPDWSHLSDRNFDIGAPFTLRQVRNFELSPKSFDEFPFFLDSILFASDEKKPSLQQIRTDFGDTSAVFINAMRTLNSIAVACPRF